MEIEGQFSYASISKRLSDNYEKTGARCKSCGDELLFWKGERKREFNTETGSYIEYCPGESIPCQNCWIRLMDLIGELTRISIMRSDVDRLLSSDRPNEQEIKKAQNRYDAQQIYFNESCAKYGIPIEKVLDTAEKMKRPRSL